MIKCNRCKKDIEPTVEEKTFSNGVLHLSASCPDCKRWIKYLPQETKLSEVIMPFGKHKNERIIDIDSDYLYWLLENDIVKGNLKNNIERIFKNAK